MAAKRKLLIVDDSTLNRQVLSKMLSEQYEIIEAENGIQALDVLGERANEISLILLDIVMPVMDGYTFLSIHRANPAISVIPVIVTTKFDDEDNEIKALSAGAADFITKPYRAQVIRHRVEAIINLRENAAMVNLLEFDRITGVYSKEFFHQNAKRLIDENPDTEYDIICSDIRSFKLLNDAYGTKVCNELLAHFAKLFSEIAGEDGICGRLDADTFALILKRRNEYDNSMFAEINRKVNSFSIPTTVVVKYGIFRIDDRSMPVNQMCDRALLAIKDLKQKYDRLFDYYNSAQLQALLDEQAIIDTMEEALEQRQFVVYFQPKYNIKENKIYGAEALVRWVHPEKGFMPPTQFIPLFERNGFIYKLDRFVWEETCRLIRSWIDNGMTPVPISVNVSRYDFYDPDLPNVIHKLTQKYGIEPKLLHLEITESAYTEDPDQIIEIVDKLRALGFTIEMDDFGAGYSSLNMLSKLPIDILKLDMKFIQNEGTMNRGRNILSFVISLARWMNLTVNAEGVENEDQVERLREMDCNYVQGFYFARPMPSWQFAELLLTAPIDSKGELLQIEAQPENLIAVCEAERPKGCMMIVDDIKVNRSVLKNYFSADFNIVEAKNGAAAMEYIKEHPKDISIILLDLVMPVMDGFQVLKTLKEDSELCDIPVVVTSQYGEGNEARAIEMGALDYLSKPYNEKLVVRRVYNALASATLSRQEKALGLG